MEEKGSEKIKSAKEYFQFQLERKIVHLSKSFLFLLEGLIDEEYNISEEKFAKMRKFVLDQSGDAVREMNKFLERLEVTLK